MTQEDTKYRDEIIDKDEVLKMARQAGLSVGVALDGSKSMGKHEDKSFAVGRLPLEDFVAFAKLVDAKATAKEREACALESENCGAIHVAKRIRARGEA